jgi:hypothetical protein
MKKLYGKIMYILIHDLVVGKKIEINSRSQANGLSGSPGVGSKL